MGTNLQYSALRMLTKWIHLCNHHPDQELEYYQHSRCWDNNHVTSATNLSKRLPLIWLLSPYLSIACFWTLYNWNKSIFSFVSGLTLYLQNSSMSFFVTVHRSYWCVIIFLLCDCSTVWLSILVLMGVCLFFPFCFHFGTIISKTAINILIYLFCWTYICVSVQYISRTGVELLRETLNIHTFSFNRY